MRLWIYSEAVKQAGVSSHFCETKYRKKILMSNEDIHQRTNCRLCESNNLKMVNPLEKIPLTEKYINKNQLNTPHELFPTIFTECYRICYGK